MNLRPPPAPERMPCTRDTPQCEIRTWGADALRPDCCTEHLLELTGFVDDLLERHGIVHWLDYGTLLGAVRNGELIPWDGDVDLGILDRDVEAVLALAPEVEQAGYVVKLVGESVVRVSYSSVNDSHVDLFAWREENGSLRHDEDPAFQWPGMTDRTTFAKTYVETLAWVELHGRAFPAPHDPHRFLRDHRYGPDYLTPVREIVNSDIRKRIAFADVASAPTELLQVLGDRNSHLLALAAADSSLLRMVRTVPGSGKWALLCGLPLGPKARHLEAARGAVQGEEKSDAVESLVWSLAWIERSIEEYERPPRVLWLRRATRRPVWLVGGLGEKLRLRNPRP